MSENNQHRKEILQSALKVIAEKKLSDTTTREIAKSAGISHGTLHYYFPSKADLYHALIDEINVIFNELRGEEFSEKGLDTSCKLEYFFNQELDLLQNQRDLAEVFIDFWGKGLAETDFRPKIQLMYQRWRADIMDVIEEGISRGEFSEEEVELIPSFVVALLEGASLQYLIDESSIDLKALFDFSLELIADCIKNNHNSRHPYPTDLSEEQWQLIASHFPENEDAGRPRSISYREIINAICYIASTSCSWRMLPHDFPHWKTVYGYYNNWRKEGRLSLLEEELGLKLEQEN
jgi:AcrR family transcriptional regulator